MPAGVAPAAPDVPSLPAAGLPKATGRGAVPPGACQLRLFAEGYLFSTAGMALRTLRVAATLLIALTDADFAIEVDGRSRRHGVVAVRPLTETRLDACEVPMVCVDLNPTHPDYRSFTGIGEAGVLPLPRDRFAGLVESLRDFHAGRVPCDASGRLFRRVTNLAATMLPTPPPIDPRIEAVRTMLEAQAGAEPCLDTLAAAHGLSRRRMSGLFSETFGITLRQYVQALKIRRAVGFHGSGMTLTEIAAAAGFADSAHLSKVWSRAYGTPPAHFFNSGAVRVQRRRDPGA